MVIQSKFSVISIMLFFVVLIVDMKIGLSNLEGFFHYLTLINEKKNASVNNLFFGGRHYEDIGLSCKAFFGT